jgi:small subunit ribosomal protein S24e
MIMEIQISKDEKKPLLKKRILAGRLAYEGRTPGRIEVRDELAKKINAKKELVIVKRIKPDYGSQSAHLEAEIYDDEATIKAIEHEYMLVRHGAAKKEEKKAEAAEEKK